MGLQDILNEKNLTKYKLAKLSHIPYATLNDLCSNKTKIAKCSSETLYKLAKALQIPMEYLYEMIQQDEEEREIAAERERSYEYGLPAYLQEDLDRYKEALEHGSNLLDCYWGELYSSINDAEIGTGVISAEHADYLRKKYLWR